MSAAALLLLFAAGPTYLVCPQNIITHTHCSCVCMCVCAHTCVMHVVRVFVCVCPCAVCAVRAHARAFVSSSTKGINTNSRRRSAGRCRAADFDRASLRLMSCTARCTCARCAWTLARRRVQTPRFPCGDATAHGVARGACWASNE